jgi:hypothetical protein
VVLNDLSELEALSSQLEEDETPSYLQDTGRAPDFIDEAPLEEPGVSLVLPRIAASNIA